MQLSTLAALALLAAAPSAAPLPASPPASTAPAEQPAVVRIGTTAIMVIRAPYGKQGVAERAAVIQSRVDQVLLHHPYLAAKDVKLLRDKGEPVIYWGPFPILAVDLAHARANNFSSADILAHAWANNMRTAIKAFLAAKKMPDTALYHDSKDADFTYKRTAKTFDKPAMLKNTRFVFAPEDLEWGAGVKAAGQHGFVVFAKKDAADPPATIYLGNGDATFTEYEIIKPEDTP